MILDHNSPTKIHALSSRLRTLKPLMIVRQFKGFSLPEIYTYTYIPENKNSIGLKNISRIVNIEMKRSCTMSKMIHAPFW